ncbi:hypothetical protein LINPERHAP2_LOCUS25277 [Linum perenne]
MSRDFGRCHHRFLLVPPPFISIDSQLRTVSHRLLFFSAACPSLTNHQSPTHHIFFFLAAACRWSESVSRLPFFPAKAVQYSESTSFILVPLFGSIQTLSPVRQLLKWLLTVPPLLLLATSCFAFTLEMSSGGDGRATASASKSRQPKRKKNAPRSRRDPGWEYATDIDGDSKKTKCKFCSKVLSGGIFRFKHHLARMKENVEPCLSVPDDVRKQMLDVLDLNLEAKEARKNLLHRGISTAASATGSQETIYSSLRASGSSSVPPTRTQTTMSTLLKKDLRKDATKSIARWFYLTGTSFNATREPEYYTMFELAARHGPGCLSEHKGDLMSMFSSETWRKSTFSTTREGKRIQEIALDSRFWTSVLTCLRAAMPLMKVLRLVDSDELPSMPFLYLELKQAMEKIKSYFSNIEKRYKPVLNIIEKRWNDQMSRPLHYAAYWLNPKVHFGENFDPNERKLKVGLYDCVERLSKDRDESLTIMQQLDTFHHSRGMFSSYGSMQLLDRKHLADWWSSFGDDVPELQKFAIRILSLTCSASGCERNWSVFERVHSKKRNRLLQKKMNDIVYVMYNSKLLRRQAKDIERIFDEIDSDDEWLAGEDGEVENENENENAEELMGIDDEATFEDESTHEQSFPDEEQRFEEEFFADEDEGGDRGNNEEEIGDENAYAEDEEDEELDFNVDPKDLM